jgi:hypothetical protein
MLGAVALCLLCPAPAPAPSTAVLGAVALGWVMTRIVGQNAGHGKAVISLNETRGAAREASGEWQEPSRAGVAGPRTASRL